MNLCIFCCWAIIRQRYKSTNFQQFSSYNWWFFIWTILAIFINSDRYRDWLVPRFSIRQYLQSFYYRYRDSSIPVPARPILANTSTSNTNTDQYSSLVVINITDINTWQYQYAAISVPTVSILCNTWVLLASILSIPIDTNTNTVQYGVSSSSIPSMVISIDINTNQYQ